MSSDRHSPAFATRISFLASVAISLALAGCSAVPPRAGAQAERESLYLRRAERIGALQNWILEGRLAVSDGSDGGSGNLKWRQDDGASRMDFHGAFGRGAWRLEAGPAGAEIEFADGERYAAPSVDELVRGQVGWPVPVDSLAWWVRGLAAPGEVGQRIYDEQGRLSELRQAGWNIEFSRYGEVGGAALPYRLTARQEERLVKLAVRNWALSAAGTANE